MREALGIPAQRASRPLDCDLVVHLVGEPHDEERARPILEPLACPVLRIRMDGSGEGLAFASFSRHWMRDRVLLEAMRVALPAQRRTVFEHIVRAWEARNDERLRASMAAIAQHVVAAARELEEVHAGSLSVKSLLPAERDAQGQARRNAMERIVQRVDASAHRMLEQLHAINGVDAGAGVAMEHRLEERFVVQQPVDAPQAGMAGAATGAAMGASVDLLAGGLTLGAAAALGALVGGGAAFIAAAWKNRALPGGATVVQLSDAMLDAVVEAALLRYVAIVHWARGFNEIEDSWRAEVARRVESQRLLLAGYWNTARTQPNPDRLVPPLAQELAATARAVLMHINP
jgi:hypothetical protein